MFSWSGRKKQDHGPAFADRFNRVAGVADVKRNTGTWVVDRRRSLSDRAPAYAAAAIELASGERVDVIVSNVNDDGAEVRSHRRLVVTPVFDLIVPSLSLHRQARIVWRDANIYGVEFLN